MSQRKDSLVEPPHRRVYAATELQLKAARLWAQGKGATRIARELHKSPPQIHETLRLFRPVADWMRHAVASLEGVHYYRRKDDLKNPPQRIGIIGNEAIGHLLDRGTWPFKVPLGCHLTSERQLEVNKADSGVAERVKRVFERVARGEVPNQVAIDEGLRPDRVLYICRNPVYTGKVTFRGRIIQVMREPLIGEDRWNLVQKRLKGRPRHQLGYGFQWKEGSKVVDPSNEETIKNVYKLRREGKSRREISTSLGLGLDRVRLILKYPEYEKVVGNRAWREAQLVKASRAGKVGDRNVVKIIGSLLDKPDGARSAEIAQAIGLGQQSVIRHLNRLRQRGQVVKGQGRVAKYLLVRATATGPSVKDTL